MSSASIEYMPEMRCDCIQENFALCQKVSLSLECALTDNFQSNFDKTFVRKLELEGMQAASVPHMRHPPPRRASIKPTHHPF